LIAAQTSINLGFVFFKVGYNKVANTDVLLMQSDIISFKVHSFALSCSSTVVFFVGFLLNKYVVFTGSNLKGRVQLFRYLLSAISSFCINYFLLNALVLYLHFHPVLAQIIVTVVVVTISFFMQQYFTFKVKEEA
jgi:putative flippase GtrA